MKDKPIFLDSNVLITAKNDTYPFDVFPSILSKKLIILDVVKNEILAGNDSLTTWLRDLNAQTMTINNQKIVDAYSQVSTYVYSLSQNYSPAVIDSWFGNMKIADPWLIAAALAYDGILVTNETVAKPNAKKRLLIPNIASHFSIPCVKITQIMRELEIKL